MLPPGLHPGLWVGIPLWLSQTPAARVDYRGGWVIPGGSLLVLGLSEFWHLRRGHPAGLYPGDVAGLPGDGPAAPAASGAGVWRILESCGTNLANCPLSG